MAGPLTTEGAPYVYRWFTWSLSAASVDDLLLSVLSFLSDNDCKCCAPRFSLEREVAVATADVPPSFAGVFLFSLFCFFSLLRCWCWSSRFCLSSLLGCRVSAKLEAVSPDDADLDWLFFRSRALRCRLFSPCSKRRTIVEESASGDDRGNRGLSSEACSGASQPTSSVRAAEGKRNRNADFRVQFMPRLHDRYASRTVDLARDRARCVVHAGSAARRGGGARRRKGRSARRRIFRGH